MSIFDIWSEIFKFIEFLGIVIPLNTIYLIVNIITPIIMPFLILFLNKKIGNINKKMSNINNIIQKMSFESRKQNMINGLINNRISCESMLNKATDKEEIKGLEENLKNIQNKLNLIEKCKTEKDLDNLPRINYKMYFTTKLKF